MSDSVIQRHFPTVARCWTRLLAIRPPRVRLTRRVVTVALVILILAAGYGAARRRWADVSLTYQRKAERYVLLTVAARKTVGDLTRRLEEGPDPPDLAIYEAFAEAKRRSNRYHDLAVKYYLASNRPWLPVAPDPPEPE
jgi:hypothetical protein